MNYSTRINRNNAVDNNFSDKLWYAESINILIKQVGKYKLKYVILLDEMFKIIIEGNALFTRWITSVVFYPT